MTVALSDEDVRTGFRNSRCNCPIARSLRRAGATKILVFKNACSFWLGDKYVFGTLPMAARVWVKEWDGGKNMRPISFDLSISGASNA